MSKELIERLKNEGDGVMSRREKTLLAGYIEELEKERDQLRTELAAEQAKSMQLREALESCGYADDSTDPEMCGPYYDAELVQQALAIQPDAAALKAWLGEPVSYLYKHASAFGYGEFWSHRQNHNGVTAIESKALYSPKLLK